MISKMVNGEELDFVISKEICFNQDITYPLLYFLFNILFEKFLICQHRKIFPKY